MADDPRKVVDSVSRSNLPKDEKHRIFDWIDEKTGGALAKVSEKADYVETAKGVVGGGIEAFLVGGIIGAAEGAEASDAPALVALGAGGLAAIAASGTGWESHLERVSNTGAGIIGYKAGRKFLYEKRLAAHGETASDDKDLIMSKAQELGFA